MTKIQKAVLLAAGKGTRMRELTADLPKPMIEVRGKPVLQHIVQGLQAAGFREFLIIVGYRADVVRQFFGDGAKFGACISYITQEVQDGTGRVVELARSFAGPDPFVLAYGDILVDPANYHRLSELPDDTAAIISVKRDEDVSQGGAVFVNERFELTDLREKPKPEQDQPEIDPSPRKEELVAQALQFACVQEGPRGREGRERANRAARGIGDQVEIR